MRSTSAAPSGLCISRLTICTIWPVSPRMALLAAYMLHKAQGETLEDYLRTRVFAGVKGVTLAPEQADVDGFNTYIRRYRALLEVERAAVERL